MAANDIPVLPLVASAMVSPGWRLSASVRLPQDMQRHAVLNAARQVKLLGLGIDDASLTVKLEGDFQQWRISDDL